MAQVFNNQLANINWTEIIYYLDGRMARYSLKKWQSSLWVVFEYLFPYLQQFYDFLQKNWSFFIRIK